MYIYVCECVYVSDLDGRCPRGVMFKAVDCGMNPFILPAKG